MRILKRCWGISICVFTCGWSLASPENLYHPLTLEALVQGEYQGDLLFRPRRKLRNKSRIFLRGIPFDLVVDEKGRWRSIDIGPARWREMARDSANWNNAPWLFAKAPRDIVLSLPMKPYVQAYLLAVSDNRTGRDASLSLRCGIFQGRGYLRDVIVEVPVLGTKRSDIALTAVPGSVEFTGKRLRASLFLVPVQLPAGELLKLPQLGKPGGKETRYEIQLTRRMHIRVAAPDPFMFSRMPLGAPSSVRIFAITLESSPVMLDVRAQSTWNAFPSGRQPSFELLLSNTRAVESRVRISAEWRQKRMHGAGKHTWSLV